MRLLFALTLSAGLCGCSMIFPDDPTPKKERARKKTPKADRDRAKHTRHGEIEVGLDSAGELRTAMIHVPADLDLSQRNAVVIGLHGGKGNGARKIMPLWKDQMEKDFILVFPNGQKQDTQRGAWFVDNATEDRRHVDFLAALIDQLARDYNIDTQRVFATGFSSGAHMVNQLHCLDAKRYAGFVAMQHYLLEGLADHCTPKPPRPYMLVAATGDTKAPYAGHEGHELGAEATLDWWLSNAGCARKNITPVARKDRGDKTEVWHSTYDRCTRSAGIEFIKIEGGDHSWPSHGNTGNSCSDIDAPTEAVAFFRRRAGL
jgi:polyhydroxybutyrate depolymerase